MSSFLQFASNGLSVHSEQAVSAFFMQTTKLWQHRLIRRVQFFLNQAPTMRLCKDMQRAETRAITLHNLFISEYLL